MKKILLTLTFIPLYCTFSPILRNPNSHPCCQNAELYVYQLDDSNNLRKPLRLRIVEADCSKQKIEQELECNCKARNMYCEWICNN